MRLPDNKRCDFRLCPQYLSVSRQGIRLSDTIHQNAVMTARVPIPQQIVGSVVGSDVIAAVSEYVMTSIEQGETVLIGNGMAVGPECTRTESE